MAPQCNVIGIVVADMPRSLAFYRRLGLEAPPDSDDAPHVELPLPGGLKLALDTRETIRSFDPGWSEPNGSSRMSLAFACDDQADVDRVHADLVGAGYEDHLAPFDAFWGQRYAAVRDPDGNGVDLFAPLDVS
jgi:catechol 2,3-dioxygenase-like lactoylglutathione lyase family enzyme